MNPSLQLSPAAPIEGAPITVVLEGTAPGWDEAVVRSAPGRREAPFQVPLIPAAGEKRQGQFALYEAGTYQVEVGSLRLPFEVLPAANVSVLSELGLVSLLVIILSAGVIGWSQKKRNRS